MGTSKPQPSSSSRESSADRLDSWKEIAAYLKRDERTVRRWEAEGLPVRRKVHKKQASVLPIKRKLTPGGTTDVSVCSSLQNRVQAGGHSSGSLAG